MVCTDEHLDEELHWQRLLKEKNVPVIWILNKCDLLSDAEQTMRRIEQQCGQVPLLVSTLTGKGLDDILRSLRNKLPDETMAQGIVGRW